MEVHKWSWGPALARTEKRTLLGRIFIFLPLRIGTLTAYLENAAVSPCPQCLARTHLYIDCWMNTWRGLGDQTAGLCPCLAVNLLMNRDLSVKPALWGTPIIVLNAVSPLSRERMRMDLLSRDGRHDRRFRRGKWTYIPVLWVLDTFENVMKALCLLSRDVCIYAEFGL